jgi:hypothetical protein
MKKLFSFPIVIIVLTLIIGAGTAIAAGITHVMNQDVPATVTVTTAPPVESVLYTDSGCTVPFSGTLNFGSVEEGTNPTVNLYYRTAEITTVNALATGLPSGASLSSIASGGTLSLTINDVPVGTHNFSIKATGN